MFNTRRMAAALTTLAVVGAAACSDSTGPSSRTVVGAASADRGSSVDDNNNNRHGGANGGGQNQDGNANNQSRMRTIVTLTSPAANAPFAGASGKAQFDTRPGENELEIEVEHLPAGTVVNFFVGDAQVGTGTVGALREAEINLNSRAGDTIPTIAPGTAVSVRTAAGTVIVSGSF